MKQTFYKRIYGLHDFYYFLKDAVASFAILRKARRQKIISKAFQERLMLAVTQVNGCEMCSYYHSKVALKSGMTEEEIHKMLAGESDTIPSEESVAVLFAQHYAESAGQPDPQTWQRLIQYYGMEKAQVILAYIRIIMMGNIYGIAAGALLSRLKGQPVKKSAFLQELLILISVIILMPFFYFQKIFGKLQERKI